MEVLFYRGSKKSRTQSENRYKVEIMHLEVKFFFREQKDAASMRRLIVFAGYTLALQDRQDVFYLELCISLVRL